MINPAELKELRDDTTIKIRVNDSRLLSIPIEEAKREQFNRRYSLNRPYSELHEGQTYEHKSSMGEGS